MRRRSLLAPAVLVLAVSGCGSDPEGSPPDPTSAASPTESETTPAVAPPELTNPDELDPGFPVDEVPVVDGTVVNSPTADILAINVALPQEEAWADAVARLESAGFTGEIDDPGIEGTFTSEDLVVELLVVFDGPDNSGVSYDIE